MRPALRAARLVISTSHRIVNVAMLSRLYLPTNAKWHSRAGFCLLGLGERRCLVHQNDTTGYRYEDRAAQMALEPRWLC